MNPFLAFFLRLLLLILSYVLVGWIGYSIYTDLRKGVVPTDHTAYPPIAFKTEIDDEAQTQIYSSDVIIIGRDPACDYTIQNETISSQHCKVSYHHQQWWVEDLDSTNGSYLNNAQIDAPVVLTDGDELRLGQVFITIQIH